jgi:hypothetical protein
MVVHLKYTKDNDVTHLSAVDDDGVKHGVFTSPKTGKIVVVYLACAEEFDTVEEAFRFIENER